MRQDIDLNFVAHPLTGDLAMKRGKFAVDQSIKNLVLTNYYERGFSVEIGSNLTDSLFDNFTPLLEQTIKSNITRVISNFEPDVEIVQIIVQMDNPNELLVEIYYSYLNDTEINSINIPIKRLR